jgi:hypothetical protein
MKMRTTIKTLVLAVAAIICATVEASAQQLSAAIVDQHNPNETSNYKFMMLGLAVIYVVYTMLNMKRKRELNRLMGKAK